MFSGYFWHNIHIQRHKSLYLSIYMYTNKFVYHLGHNLECSSYNITATVIYTMCMCCSLSLSERAVASLVCHK